MVVDDATPVFSPQQCLILFLYYVYKLLIIHIYVRIPYIALDFTLKLKLVQSNEDWISHQYWIGQHNYPITLDNLLDELKEYHFQRICIRMQHFCENFESNLYIKVIQINNQISYVVTSLIYANLQSRSQCKIRRGSNPSKLFFFFPFYPCIYKYILRKLYKAPFEKLK